MFHKGHMETGPWLTVSSDFWPALSDNWSWKPVFCLFESGCFTQVLLYTWSLWTVSCFCCSSGVGSSQLPSTTTGFKVFLVPLYSPGFSSSSRRPAIISLQWRVIISLTLIYIYIVLLEIQCIGRNFHHKDFWCHKACHVMSEFRDTP